MRKIKFVLPFFLLVLFFSCADKYPKQIEISLENSFAFSKDTLEVLKVEHIIDIDGASARSILFSNGLSLSFQDKYESNLHTNKYQISLGIYNKLFLEENDLCFMEGREVKNLTLEQKLKKLQK